MSGRTPTTSRAATPRLFCILLGLLTMTSVSQAGTTFSQGGPSQGTMLTTLKDNSVPGYELECGRGSRDFDGFSQAVAFHSKMGRDYYHYTFASLDPDAPQRFAAGGDAFTAITSNQRDSGVYVNSPEEISQLEYRFHQIPKDQLEGTVSKATWSGVLSVMQEARKVFGADDEAVSTVRLIKKLERDLVPQGRHMTGRRSNSAVKQQLNDMLKNLALAAGIANFEPEKCGLIRMPQNKTWRNWVHLNLEAAARLTTEEKQMITPTWYDINHAAAEFGRKGGDADNGAPITIYLSRAHLKWNPDQVLAEIKADGENVEAWKIRAYLYCQSFYSIFSGYGYGLSWAKLQNGSAYLRGGAQEYVFKNQSYPPTTLVTLIDGDCMDLEGIPEPKIYSEIDDEARDLSKKSSSVKNRIKDLLAVKELIKGKLEKANEEMVRIRIERVKKNLSSRHSSGSSSRSTSSGSLRSFPSSSSLPSTSS